MLRLPKSVDPATLSTDAEVERWSAGPWHPTLVAVLLIHAASWKGPVPLVVVVDGYVRLCREVVDQHTDEAGLHLELAEPGGWAETFQARRWRLGSGGRTFRYRTPEPHPRWCA